MSPEEFLELLQEVGSDDPRFLRLPVEGNLNLAEWEKSHPSVKRIPACIIKGDVDARGCKSLERLDCKVEGTVDLRKSGVVELGKSFSSSGDFLAAECTRLKVLRGHFGADVLLQSSSIVEIPSGVKIAGSLSISKCDYLITVGCEVGGSLHAVRSGISSLGKDFRCAGDVNIQNCPNLKTLGYIGSPRDVYLTNSGVEAVDEDFECRESFYANDNKKLRRVGDSSGINVGKVLLVSGSPRISSVKVTKVKGDSQIVRCQSLKEVAGHFSGSLFLSRCGVENLTDALRTGGNLIVEKCPKLKSLSPRSARNIELSDLRSLDLVSGKMKCGNDMIIHHCPSLKKISGEIVGDFLLFGPVNIPVIDQTLKIQGGFRSAGATRSGKNFRADLVKIGRIEAQFGGEVTLNQVHLGSTGSSFSCESFYMGMIHSNPDLRGKVRGNVAVGHSPIEKIGAAFECGGDMKLEKCMALSGLNCNISGNLLLFECLVPALLPAFHCSGSVMFLDCVNSEGERVPKLVIPTSTQSSIVSPSTPKKNDKIPSLKKPSLNPSRNSRPAEPTAKSVI